MASKVDSVMSTSIALETLKASNSINSLTKAVRSSTSAWKAQEAQLKSNGDYLKASEAKYEGLGKSIEAEKKRIEALQDKMKDLDQTTQEGAKQAVRYGDQLNKATTSLKSMEAQQQRAYEALKREKSGINGLNSSMRQRNSLSKAITERLEAEGKHEQALKEKRDNARKSIDDISKALKKEEALLKDLEKNNGSTSAINKQRIAVEKLKTSMAESKSSVSKFDKELKELNPSPIQRLRKSFGGLKKEGKETHSVFKQVFSGTFWGEVAHGAASQAFTAIKMGFGGIIKAGNEFNKEQQVMNATWTTLTGNASKGEGFVKSINKMSTAFGQSTDLVNELDQQFYHVLDKKGPTEELTKSVLTMADTLGMSADDVKRLGLNFTHMMSSSKMQLGDFNMISDQLPMFGERLLDYERKMQHNNALSMSDLRKQMSAGKISAKDAEAVMNGLGQKYKAASENMMKTAAGAERSIKARFSALSGDLAKPFTTMQSPIFEAVSKWVSDPKTENKFTEVGKAASKGFQTITTALTKALDIKNGPKAMNNFMDGLAKSIKSVSNVIAQHSKEIVGFFKGLWSSLKIIGSIGAGFFKGLISGLGAVVKPLAKMTGHGKAVKGLSGALGELSKHKSGLQTLGKVLAGVFITSKALGFASSLTKVAKGAGLLEKSYSSTELFGKGIGKSVGFLKQFSKANRDAAKSEGTLTLAQKAFNLVSKDNPIGIVVTAVVALGVALFELYKHNKKFRDMVNGWGKAISKFTSGALKGIGKFFSDFGKSWNNFWGGIGSGIGKAWKGASKKVSSGASSIRKAFSKKIGDISDWFGDVGKGISKWWNNFSKAFKKGFDSFVKKAKGFFKGLGKVLIYSIAFAAGLAMIIFGPIVKAMNKGIGIIAKPIKKMGKVVSKAFIAIWKPLSRYVKTELTLIGKIIRQVINGWVKIIKTVGKALFKAWQAVWKPLSKFLSKTLSFMGRLWKGFTTGLSKVWNSFSKAFKKSWSIVWNAISKFFSNIFNGIHKKFKDWTSAISKTWNGFKNWFSKKWSNMWNGVHDFFHGITKKLSKTFSNWTSGAMNILGSFGNKFKDGWNGLVKGVKSIFSGLWNSMKEMAADGLNAVIGVINKGVGGINSVIHTFGGKKQTIKPIGHVHFATGTGSLGSSNFRRAINSITPAIVNDEPGASNPELIFRKATGTVEYSKEKNAETVLFPGDEVANASDSAKLAPMLGITHFAGGGIGDFFGGIINGAKSIFGKVASGLKGLFEVGTKIIAHPIKALEGLMPFSSKGAKGFFPTIAKGGFNFVKNQAKKWWSTLWSMVDFSGDGGGSYGGGWQSPGSGWTHTDGFGSPRGGGVHDGNDFSARVGTPFHAMHGGTVIRVGGAPAGWGPVGYNIVTRDSTGKEIIYQEFGNAKDVRVHKGQHVKTGDVLGVLGRSGLGTGPHLHVGLTNGGSVWNRSGMSTRGWLDITKQHGKDKGSDAESSSGDSRLQQMIKKQVGSGFWNTIKKIASLFGDNGGSGNPGGSGVQRWKSDVKRALSKLGLSTSASMVNRVLRQINTESGGNPRAMGGTDGLADGHAMGLMQVKPGTFRAYHLPGHNNIWNGFDNLLAGLNYAKHRYGHGLSFLGNGHGYANGGIATTPSIFGEAGPEMAIPLSMTRSDRANQLLGETIVHMAKNNPDRIADNDTAYGSNGSRELITKLDKLTKLAGNMVALLQEQILATRDGAFNKDALYRTQALNQSITDFQSY
ncbi:tape measure protein [Weissella paramesenteroides]|uniref:tape measure protein n=1 Tax=Weissella paramesenteroides TaxID=1249 RepID=UPI002E7B1C26|nr:tape measure protein [Weissella paramesenteroides]WPQ69020.1 tape measure protein [Weissella paramesenteroides]